MRFRSYDGLRIFAVVAGEGSFTAAAKVLNLTKGAVSYQIAQLEGELGFPVFRRRPRGIDLTEQGERLWRACRPAFRDLEAEIARLRAPDSGRIVVGLSTYFASRWLSPRLMTFISEHPEIGLRLEPLTDLSDFEARGIDMAIRWGRGDWSDAAIEPLFRAPAFPTAGAGIASRIAESGLETLLPDLPLLHDRDGSDSWRDWHDAAGLPYRPGRDDLVVPDPNVRVQAVINGQGLALNDQLVDEELSNGTLFRISGVALERYGYFLAYPEAALENPSLRAFYDWIRSEASR